MTQIDQRYLVNGLIDKLKSNNLIPSNQNTYDDEDFANFLSRELLGIVAPDVNAMKVDSYTTFLDYDVQPNQNRYPLPIRANGGKVKTVSWKANNDLPDDSHNFYHMQLTSPELISSTNWQTAASPGYYIEGNDIIIYPTPTQSNKFRVWYYRTPNSLVPRDQGAIITAVDLLSNIITLSNIPVAQKDGQIWQMGDQVDIIRPFPPFRTILEDITIVNIETNSFDVQLSSTTGIQINDTVALVHRAIVAQLPVELEEYLISSAALKVLHGIGDERTIRTAAAIVDGYKKRIALLVAPRVDSDPPRLVGSNGISNFVRGNRRWY